MKKVLAVFLLVLICIGACGCGSKTETVTTDGSTSMEKVIGYLSEAFKEENGTEVSYNPTGSTTGITSVKEGRCDIGLSSRDLKDEEKESLTATVVAIDGIAIVVNNENNIDDLTVEQISKLFTGEITNWSEIGGSDAPVVPIGREGGSGTRDGFESVTKTDGKCKYSQELTSSGDVITAVAGNKNAIGYASVASVGDIVKDVKVDSVAPTTETIQDGSYKIQRNFNFVTKKDGKLSDSAQAFFDFVTSKASDSLIEKAGAVPVKR